MAPRAMNLYLEGEWRTEYDGGSYHLMVDAGGFLYIWLREEWQAFSTATRPRVDGEDCIAVWPGTRSETLWHRVR